MDLDNPSYFSVLTDEPDCSTAQIRRKNRMGNSESASETSLSGQLTPPRCNNRRELRNFLRSCSTNSADSNQELLIMGEPRLSDMAPDLAFKHPSRSNSLKRSQDNGPYFPLPTSEETADELLQEDEVFLEEGSARYCNLSAMIRISNGSTSPKGTSSPRRHSISTFGARDRTNSVASSSRSFKDDFSQMVQESDVAATSAIDEHSLRHMSYPRKRCLKCSKGTLSRSQANMDDILIVSLRSSERANLWVEYFASYFDLISKQADRKSFKIRNVSLEDLHTSQIEDKKFVESATGVKLQLVVVCPAFLSFVADHPEESANLTKLLLPDRTLALLLLVTDSDLTDVHKRALPSYFQWQRQCVDKDQDETFTKEFLAQAMTILSRIWKQQSSVLAQEKSCFLVTPKKIRQGQNSVFIILTYPLQKEDIIKISVERNGELHEIKSPKRRNPYTIKIYVPENLTDVTAIVNILVEKNGSIIGSRPIKCESKFRELEQILRSANSPVDFMCQTLGFCPADREHLDNWLVHGFLKNLPPHFNLLANHNTPFAATVPVHKHSNEEFPTLLHFAAKFGLKKLATQLMHCPAADIAYDIKNIFDMTPSEIARANGHHELSNFLGGYMEMNEVTAAYTKLKELSMCHESTESTDVDNAGYLKPKEIADQCYKWCPAPRPVNPEMTESSPTPVFTPSSDCSSSLYLAMDRTAVALSREDIRSALENLHPWKDPQHASTHRPPSPNPKRQPTNPQVIEDKVQRELAEILNDFKNNVHSFTQVEALVEEWKSRKDVQESFHEKEKQLNELRLCYKKIQQHIKAATKKPSPLEQIIKIFFRKRHNEKSVEATSLSVITGPDPALNLTCRPISSLSTSSSGSSARMSTGSSCSMGDSGTHSDVEDRKMMFGILNDQDFKESQFQKVIAELNYSPLPAPKPVIRVSNLHLFETIDENRPVTRPDTLDISSDQFYIRFPPSGRPVAGLAEPQSSRSTSGSPRNDYMNVPGSEESHDYINYKPPS